MSGGHYVSISSVGVETNKATVKLTKDRVNEAVRLHCIILIKNASLNSVNGTLQTAIGVVLRATCLLGTFAKLWKATISFVSVRLSVRMQKLDSHWIILMKFDTSGFSRKSVKRIQVSLKYNKNEGYFTWRSFHMYDNTSLNFSYDEKCFKYYYRDNQNMLFMFSNFFPPKIVQVMRLIRKIWWSQIGRKKYGTFACHAE